MREHTEDTKRIAKNTMMLYIRMLLIMIVSLYTTRVVLNVLGANDYGIYNLVGGVVGLMGMVTSLLSQGTSRFITIALGKNDKEELRNTFSASMSIHFALAIFILLIGEIIGPWVINGLNIEPNRMEAAHFVFQLSLLSSIIGVIQIPYHAVIVAHERMKIFVYVSLWDAIAKLLVVYILLVVNIDKLKLFSFLYFITGIISALFYYIYCRKKFSEYFPLALFVDSKLYKMIVSYVGWNAIGSCAYTMNGQGITILLNVFGTSVNAARGIANSISGVIHNFVGNFLTASKPQIMKLCAVNDYARMNSLIMNTSKYSAYLMGLIGIPLFLEMDYILEVWLVNVPEYTVTFARLALIQGLIQTIDYPIGTGIHAIGKMKLPNLTSSFIYMIILPVSYIAIKLGASPDFVYIMTICIYPLAFIMDLYILKLYADFPVLKFLFIVVFRVFFFILVTAVMVKYFVQIYFEQKNIELFIITILLSSVCLIVLVYMGGITNGERKILNNWIKQKIC